MIIIIIVKHSICPKQKVMVDGGIVATLVTWGHYFKDKLRGVPRKKSRAVIYRILYHCLLS